MPQEKMNIVVFSGDLDRVMSAFIIATDEGIKTDLPAWCKTTGHEFLGVEEKNGEFRATVRKIKD
jgi:hypothetical protein